MANPVNPETIDINSWMRHCEERSDEAIQRY